MSPEERINKIRQIMKQHKISTHRLIRSVPGDGCTNLYMWLQGKSKPSADGLYKVEQTLERMIK